MKYPNLTVKLEKIKSNAGKILDICKKNNIEPALVGKCICEYNEIIMPLIEMGFPQIADSRTENLRGLQAANISKLLLRIGMLGDAEEIVNYSDISLQSERNVLKEINEYAEYAHVKHKVILMIDLGDLREGIFYKDKNEILKTARYIRDCKGLELYGIGTNLTCYGSVVPDQTNLGILCNLAEYIRKDLGVQLPVVSGGNSSSIRLVVDGKMPNGVNHLRIGETVFLGTDTSTGRKFDFLFDDAFILETMVIEVKNKPSYPIGRLSVNAFGEQSQYEDLGMMRRGILAIGRQDVNPNEIVPLDEKIKILGASSDHLLVNLNDAPEISVGDVVRFKLKYGALLSCFTGKYISKRIETQ